VVAAPPQHPNVTVKRFIAAALASMAAIVLGSTDLAAGDAQSRAGLVIRYDDDRVERMCVVFDEPSISGLELLERSDVPFLAERSALGSAICKVGERGCDHPDEDCWCDYPTFWGYWSRDSDDDVWTFSELGASDRDVKDGDLNGWSWGKDGKPAPPADGFADVCPASARKTEATVQGKDVPPAPGRANYAAFAAFALLLAGAVAVLMVRRRRA
jgi:hypothetical protein